MVAGVSKTFSALRAISDYLSHLISIYSIGDWCNGSMPLSKSVGESSNLSSPAKPLIEEACLCMKMDVD